MQKIVPHLWFDLDAEDAVEFYVSIFKNSRIKNKFRYGDAGAKASGMPKGSIMNIVFEIEGQEFMALNGGPVFKFNESVSFIVNCDTQTEIDYYWEKLSEGGDEKAQICGWLKDKYGLSWQIVPSGLEQMMEDPEKSEKVMREILKMKKIDMGALRRAAEEV